MDKSLDRRRLLALAGLSALGAASPAQAEDAPKPALDSVARDATLGRTLDDKEPKVADYDGKVVVVSFWASWCGPCLQEFPYLDRLQQLGGDKLQVVSVSTEERKVFVKLQRALSEKVQLLMTYDPGKRCAATFKAPGSLPYMVVLRRDRTVAGIRIGWGSSSTQDLADLVNGALAT